MNDNDNVTSIDPLDKSEGKGTNFESLYMAASEDLHKDEFEKIYSESLPK